MSNLVFFYGTLMTPFHRAARLRIDQHLVPVGRGSIAAALFDLGIYPVGATKQVTFSEPGVSRLFCNIHPNMAGYVVAVDSPWFATSDADGRFSIPDVEPGTYTWRAWRAAGPVVSGSVTVRAGAVLEVAWP